MNDLRVQYGQWKAWQGIHVAGIRYIPHDYEIEKERLWEPHWLMHLREKQWFDKGCETAFLHAVCHLTDGALGIKWFEEHRDCADIRRRVAQND